MSTEFTDQDLQITFSHVKAIAVDPSLSSGDSRVRYAVYRQPEAPQIITDLTGDIYASIGSSTSFYISGVCSPPAAVKWYRNGSSFEGSATSSIETIYTPSNSSTKLSTDTGVYSTLTFPDSTIQNIGSYKCVLINNFGTASSETKNLYVGAYNDYEVNFSPSTGSEIRFGNYSGIYLATSAYQSYAQIYYTTGDSDSLVDPSVTPTSASLRGYSANSPTLLYAGGPIYFPADIDTGYIKALVCFPDLPFGTNYRYFPSAVTSGIYLKRSAVPSTYNIPSGAFVGAGGFDFAVSSTNEQDAETYIKMTGDGLLADLTDPLTTSVYGWVSGYFETPARIYSGSAIKTIVSGAGLEPYYEGFSFDRPEFQNLNVFNPSSGFYYDFIDVNVPVENIKIYTENGYTYPEVGLRYTTGVTGSTFDAPTSESELGIQLGYDGASSFTGRLDVSGDFDFKSLIVESGTNYLVTWTGDVSGTLKNKIQFNNFEFIDITTAIDGLGPGSAGSNAYNIKSILNINPVKISAGASHACGIASNGNLYCVGLNDLGQLGIGSTDNYTTPQFVTGNVASVDCGISHTAFITQNGALYTCGDNSFGQLGDGNTSSRWTPYLVSSEALSVSCGNYHTAFISGTNSELYTFGSNFYGQLGDGTTETRRIPTLVTGNVDSVSCGGYHTAYIDTTSGLYTFGSNYFGQLGDGETDNRSTPYNVLDQCVLVSLGAYETFYRTFTNGIYSFNSDAEKNPATLIYFGSVGDDQPIGVSKSISISLEQLGSNRELYSFLTYTLDGSDPTESSDKAYLLNTTTGVTSGSTNLFFIPDTGLNIFATGTEDPVSVKVKAFVTGDSIGNAFDSDISSAVFYRKTLSPVFQTINYYSEIADSEQTTLSNVEEFNGSFGKNADIVINFENYTPNRSSGALDFYVNGNLISSSTGASTGAFTILSTDNTNTGWVTFSGYSSGYSTADSVISGYFERYKLLKPSGTQSGYYETVSSVYPITFYNNSENPPARIRYTLNGSDPTSTNGTVTDAGSTISVASDQTITVKWIATTGGYLDSDIESGIWEIVQV